MDFVALKKDVKEALKHLPAEVQIEAAKIFHVIVKHMPIIEKVGPLITPILSPHLQAGAVEFAMGMVDREGLDKALREAFQESGLALPDMPKAQGATPSEVINGPSTGPNWLGGK